LIRKTCWVPVWMPRQENDAASGPKGPAEANVPGAKPLSLTLRSIHWVWAESEVGAQRNETVAVPSSRQAIFEAERPDLPAGTVVEVLQPGYILHDRLLRPAMVGVAKGGAA